MKYTNQPITTTAAVDACRPVKSDLSEPQLSKYAQSATLELWPRGACTSYCWDDPERNERERQEYRDGQAALIDRHFEPLLTSHAALVEALENARSLIIEHHSYDIMKFEHHICPACSCKRGDDMLNAISEALLAVIGPAMTKFTHQASLQLERDIAQSIGEANAIPAIEA